jgi:sugar O-acyltransferase (sialic acid O-acetyltransferase NeuD family)
MSIIIIGGGGHCGSVVEAIRKFGNPLPIGIIDDRFTGIRWGVPILNPKDVSLDNWAFVAIGDNHQRHEYSKRKFRYANVTHPTALRSSVASPGTFYGANSYVGPGCIVGKFCIINTGAILEHDSELGDFSHLCPGVVTGGSVKIGSFTTIGLGSMIRDKVEIGSNCTIGMGSVVTKDIPDNSTAWGNPCKIQHTK